MVLMKIEWRFDEHTIDQYFFYICRARLSDIYVSVPTLKNTA